MPGSSSRRGLYASLGWVARQARLAFGMNMWIAERLTKMGGGRPTSAAVKELLGKIDNNEDWYPGKQHGEKYGCKRVLRGAKAVAVARCAQGKKARGVGPTYAQVCGSCKDAVFKPATGKAVGKRAVYLPPRPWEETATEFPRRLRAVVEDINACHSVEGLCRELPQHVLALHAAQGLDK